MRASLLLAAICVASTDASAVNPMEKVVKLLKDLQAKVEKQGTLEATQYDKYACFCTNQAKFKAAAIAKSTAEIAEMDADLADLTADITAADTESAAQNVIVKDMAGDAAATDQVLKDGKIKVNQDTRATALALYVGKSKDLEAAIASTKEALENMKASKTSMTGADLNLVQLKVAVSTYKASQTQAAMSETLALVKMASASSGTQPAYKFQGNAIIEMIEQLSDDFKNNLKTLDEDEMTARSTSESNLMKFTNKRNFAQKEKDEQDALSQAKTSEKQETQEARDLENANKVKDQAFVTQLETGCAQKASDWDQRSKSTADEMAALAEATTTLEKGAMAQYDEDKKLTLVQAEAAPVSFLQRRSVESAKAAAVQRVLADLDAAATSQNSPALAAIALKVALKKDHFTNIRALIKDLITKLRADAAAEATTKAFCDQNMFAAITDRDQSAADLETQEGIISTKSTLAAVKAAEVKKLANEIAELNKGLLEAKDLRDSEKAANNAAIQEAKAGSKAVASALAALNAFYNPVLLQDDYTPPNADRSGKTVGDQAPESFSGTTTGSQASGQGIIGILEVIKGDFDRTDATVTKEELEAFTEYEAFRKKSSADIATKTTSKGTAKVAKDTALGLKVAAENDKDDAQNLKESALAALKKLDPICVADRETYAERVAKRKAEIESLKEAGQILDDWKA